MIIALAGRRIDAPDAKAPRFPLANVPLVEQRVGDLLERQAATAVVSSAACGADLVALQLAGRRGLRRRVVLPFAPEKFRATSVTDRPGDWGPVYDGVLGALAPAGDVVVLDGDDTGGAAYVATNHAILDDALALARRTGVEARAVVIWEGSARGSDDTTAAFADEARHRGLLVLEVSTL